RSKPVYGFQTDHAPNRWHLDGRIHVTARGLPRMNTRISFSLMAKPFPIRCDRANPANPAVVFINGLLSKERQLVWSKAVNAVSRRGDVSTDHLPKCAIPNPVLAALSF